MRTITVWAFRAVWVALAFTVAPAVGDALGDHSRPVQLTGTVGLWVGWAVVVLAALVPTTVSLTVLRALVPGAPVVAAVAWMGGADATAGTVALASAAVAAALAFSGELGEDFVQGSAYGEERRLPLRPPGPVLVVLPVAWAALAAAVLAGPLCLAARAWVAGTVFTAAAGAGGWVLGKRFHRLSKRWLVVVPAGVVVHDHLVLAETAMVPLTDVSGAGLALVGTEAADLSGTALGPRVELRLRNASTVVLAAPRGGQTRALHVLSVLVCPTRPGRALAALAERGVALGAG